MTLLVLEVRQYPASRSSDSSVPWAVRLVVNFGTGSHSRALSGSTVAQLLHSSGQASHAVSYAETCRRRNHASAENCIQTRVLTGKKLLEQPKVYRYPVHVSAQSRPLTVCAMCRNGTPQTKNARKLNPRPTDPSRHRLLCETTVSLSTNNIDHLGRRITAVTSICIT